MMNENGKKSYGKEIVKSTKRLPLFKKTRPLLMALLPIALLMWYGYEGHIWARIPAAEPQNCCQTTQTLLNSFVSAEAKEVDLAVPLITSNGKSRFNEEILPQKRTRKISDDINLRKKEFMERSVNCTGQKSNSSLSVAKSCALKLRVPSVAEASLDFDFLDARLTKAVSEAPRLPRNPEGRMKNILFWIEKKEPKYSFGRRIFEQAKCPVSRCQITRKRKLFPPEQVDAIMLHSFLLLRTRPQMALPSKQKYPNAKIVLLTGEAPIRHPDKFNILDGLVDYTMGYRRDSDIVRTRGSVYPLKTPLRDEQMHVDVRSKSKMAAWFASNCRSAPSGRTLLVSKLRDYGVDVDVYGACGQLSCSVSNASVCYEMLQRDYKFYFSFENSLCNHYVTEKFYNILTYDVVPVTFGLGHELTGAPKDAYIDAFNFPNAKVLADYLLYLDSNASAYVEYFRWKRYYGVYPNFGREDAFCKLCETLVAGTPPLRPYPDMRAWLADGQCLDVLHNRQIRDFIYGYPRLQPER